MICRMANCIFIVVKRPSLPRENMYQTITRKTRLKMMKDLILVMTAMSMKVRKEHIVL